jgi:eukaryotic-like serine/threonine-protein kinase
VILLPKGGYLPRFAARSSPDARAAPEPAAEAVSRRTRARLHWQAGLFGLLAAGALGAGWWARHGAPAPGEPPLLRLEVELKADGMLGSEPGPAFALSSDGSRLVFVARDGQGLAHLYTRRLDQSDNARIPGTEGARSPFLSPDGRWVGFWADGKIKRAPVEGGAPVVLGDATDMLGASWGTGGQIVAALNPTGRLWMIPEGGRRAARRPRPLGGSGAPALAADPARWAGGALTPC